MTLLRIALLFCPREFRDEYAAQICDDQSAHGGSELRAAIDAVSAGFTMRCEGTIHDMFMAMRRLLKARSFTIMSIFAIAIAAAVNIALAGVVNGVLLKSMPFPQAQQLVFVDIGPTTDDVLSYPESLDFAERTTVFQTIGISHRDSAALRLGHVTVGLQGRQIGGDYFKTLRVSPELGRFLTPGDLGKAFAVISDATWRRYFHADPAIVGRLVRLGPRAYTIVGVAPSTLRDPRPSGLLKASYWTPVDPAASGCVDRGCHAYVAIARLRSGVSEAQANADVARVVSAIVAANPAFYRDGARGSAHSVTNTILGPVRPLLWLLYAAAGLVLLIACANVANLQLARAARQEGQIVVQFALGASRARIIRQLSLESALLAIVSGGLGVALASVGLRAFSFSGATLLPRWESVSIDGGVALYATVLVIGITMVTGTLPALLFARDASNALRSAGHSSDKPARTVFRAALISLEIALAVALTASAGLTVRSFVALTHTDVGFNGAHLYDAYFGFLPSARYTTETSRHTFAQRLRNQIAKVPGVAVASVTNGAPFADENETNVHVPGRPDSPDQIDLYTVDGKFFKVMQLPILRGRAIQSADTDHSMPAIVVNAALAKRYFGTLDVVGKVIVPGMCAEGQKRCPRTIVGVVGDTRDSFAAAPVPTAFVPLPQLPRVSHVLIRVADDATLQAASIARAFTNTDPLVAPPNITPFSDLFREDAIRYETASLCFMIFAFVALVLALAGVYAVTAFSVTARTREFGIRKAIGATDGSVLLNVALHTLTQAAVGGALGLTIVAACGHLLEGLLYRIPAVDVQTFAGVLVLIAGCSVLAALGPAIRATRTSPALALRYE